jgi:hypothetical protein
MRKLLAVTTATVAMGVVAAAAAPGASALSLVTCNGLNTVTYSPALTNTAKQTTITSSTSWATCVSPTHPSVTAGSTGNQISKLESCTSALGGFSSSNTITWNTGQTSTFTFNGYTQEINGQYVIVLTGSITAGLFTGALATEQTTLLGDLTACSGAGISSNGGPAPLEIVGL